MPLALLVEPDEQISPIRLSRKLSPIGCRRTRQLQSTQAQPLETFSHYYEFRLA
jgi:hypothetical protein